TLARSAGEGERPPALAGALEALRASLSRSSSPAPPLVLLVGQGREVADAAARALALESIAVVRARGGESLRPLAPLPDLIRAVAAPASPPPARARGALAPLVSWIGGDPAPREREEALEARARMTDAIAEAFLASARARPLLVVIDDLDRADPDVVEAIAH